MVRKLFIGIVVALLIVLFLYTGIHKMLDFEKFRYEIGRSPFLESMVGLVSVSIPAGEIVIAALLLFPRTRTLGLYLSFFLMMLFTGYIWLMLTYAYDLPCSCGGIISELSWEEHLWFNATVSLITAAALLLSALDDVPPKRVAVSR